MHVVFGAGQVGAGLARALAAQGHRVRVVRRTVRPVGDGIEVVAGDARSDEDVSRPTAGASVVYHCVNPSAYTARAWADEFPRFGRALIGAALAHDARLVCLDNLYPYGPVAGRLTEATPHAPAGPKGVVRAEWAEALDQARHERGLRYTIGRAADFFGPGTEQALFSTELVRTVARGGTAWLLGDPGAEHAFGYLPDVARALAALGGAQGVEGETFHLPAIHVAPVALHRRLAEALGVRPRARTIGPRAMRVLSPFVPVLRELRETLYQWDRPFLVDDQRFRARFPDGWATLDAAVRETTEEITGA